ncbi:MAG: S9 family peptidase, partial [Candidatus Eremiobacterota bacterium]
MLPDARLDEEASKLERRADAEVEGEERRPCLLSRMDAGTGESELLLAGDPGLADVAVSSDGKILLAGNATGQEDGDHAFNLFLLEGGKLRPLTSFRGGRAPRGYTYDGFQGAIEPRFSPDGRSVAFLSHLQERLNFSRADVYILNLEGGALRNVSAGSDRYAQTLAWEGNTLLFCASDGTGQRFYRVDPAAGTVRPLTVGDGYWESLALSRDGRVAAGVFEDATRPPEVYLIPIDHPEAARPVTRLNEQVSAWRLASQEVLRYESEGLRLEGTVIRPLDLPPGKKAPLLVQIHGGPLGNTPNRLRHHLALQWLASRGYAIFAPNYRGSEGYGDRFARMNRGDLGGGDYRDIMAGVDALVAQGWVDPERMGVMGGSYGGYMTNWIVGHTGRFRAAVSMYGIFSLVTDFSNSNIPSFETDYLGPYWWEDPEAYRRQSPSTFVESIRTPVLILHGESDVNTDIANSREMYTALSKLGRPVEFVRYPREGHGLTDEPNHARDVILRITAWFDRHLLEVPAAPPGWTLRLVEVDEADYEGIQPADGGRFVEVAVAVEARSGAIPALRLSLAPRLDAHPLAGIPQGKV